MSGLSGMFQLVAAVIAVSGVAKAVSPDGFVSLCRTLRIPMSRRAGRVVGACELALGCWAVVVGGAPAGYVVAFAYVVFAAMVMLARRSGAASCGCFGSVSAPPGLLHAVVDLASAAVAVLAVATGNAAALPDTLRGQPAWGIPYLVALVTGLALVIAIDTVGAEVASAVGLHARAGHGAAVSS